VPHRHPQPRKFLREHQKRWPRVWVNRRVRKKIAQTVARPIFVNGQCYDHDFQRFSLNFCKNQCYDPIFAKTCKTFFAQKHFYSLIFFGGNIFKNRNIGQRRTAKHFKNISKCITSNPGLDYFYRGHETREPFRSELANLQLAWNAGKASNSSNVCSNLNVTDGCAMSSEQVRCSYTRGQCDLTSE
jgi:hypothetical protein